VAAQTAPTYKILLMRLRHRSARWSLKKKNIGSICYLNRGAEKVLSDTMKCRYCGSTRVNRSQRHGLLEGLFFRFFLLAPYRCHECGARYSAFDRSHVLKRRGRDQSLAEFIGMRGREHKLRHWILTVFATLLLLVAAIFFVLRIIG